MRTSRRRRRGERTRKGPRNRRLGDPVVRAGISYFAQLGDATDDGIARLGGDLQSGAWERRNREPLDLDELDVGYRLLTTS